MSDKQRFPWEQSRWKGNDGEKWVDELELIGPKNVRALIAVQHPEAGPASSLKIGPAVGITKGFIQEWLAWHDKREAAKEDGFKQRQIFWTRWAAWAASIAAIATAIGWGYTVLWPKK